MRSRNPQVPPLGLLALLVVLSHSTACAHHSQTEENGSCSPFADLDELAFDPTGWETDFCEHSVPYEEIFSGGPPRDGIPPIDAPQFVGVEQADEWLQDDEPVILLTVDGEARAYPLQIMTWHEIVNDRIGDRAVAVTFCPLCNAAVVFERPEVDGERLTFGTSGNLRHSDLVMWDRQTESWWQQFTGEAIVGRLTGTVLEPLPASIASWKSIRARHPEALVLSRETGYDREYGRNPYVGYDDVSQRPFLYRGEVGNRLPPMARVVGVVRDGVGRAYALDDLRDRLVINDTLSGKPILVAWQQGTASALDEARIAGSRDVGTTGVFSRRLEGHVLSFVADGDAASFTDLETGSEWNVLGEAIDGPLRGSSLNRLVHHDIFWFVWSAFRPEGTLYGID